MGGRFGKYGDAKRKAQIRKNRLKAPDPRQAEEEALERSKMSRFQGYPSFSRMANSLSALYPKGGEEKRLLDAMLLVVPK